MLIKVGDQLISYEVINPNGTMVDAVILHGWGHTGSMWRNIAELLPKGCRCFLIDLPGFGQSPITESVTCLNDYASVMNQFLAKRHLKRVLLVGHSFGAQVAVKMASKRSGVAKLVLIAPALTRERRGLNKWKYNVVKKFSIVKSLLPKGLRYQLLSGLDYSLASQKMKQIFQSVVMEDVADLLPSLAVSTLVVWAERDRDVLGTGKEVVQLIPQSKLKVIYDAGHNVHLEKPRELAQIIERWL